MVVVARKYPSSRQSADVLAAINDYEKNGYKTIESFPIQR